MAMSIVRFQLSCSACLSYCSLSQGFMNSRKLPTVNRPLSSSQTGTPMSCVKISADNLDTQLFKVLTVELLNVSFSDTKPSHLARLAPFAHFAKYIIAGILSQSRSASMTTAPG